MTKFNNICTKAAVFNKAFNEQTNECDQFITGLINNFSGYFGAPLGSARLVKNGSNELQEEIIPAILAMDFDENYWCHFKLAILNIPNHSIIMGMSVKKVDNSFWVRIGDSEEIKVLTMLDDVYEGIYSHLINHFEILQNTLKNK